MNDMTTRERLRTAGPSQQITELLVGQTRLEGKLDNVIERLTKIEEVEDTVADHEGRIIKLESFNGFVLWIVGAAFAILVAAIGAGTWWLGNGG